MFRDFLNDRCDVYHLRREDMAPGYGVPAHAAASYPKEPDLTDVPCHFNRRGGFGHLTQGEPARAVYATIKINFPRGTDIRLNDRIVNNANGMTYTAGPPMEIRRHHIAVEVQAIGQQGEL